MMPRRTFHATFGSRTFSRTTRVNKNYTHASLRTSPTHGTRVRFHESWEAAKREAGVNGQVAETTED